MAQSNFSFDLKIGKFQGSSMSIQVLVNNQEVYCNPNPAQDKIRLEFATDLPAQIKFVLGNKNPFDTQVDDLGNIVEDKHIQVSRLVIDRMPVEQWILESRLFSYTDTDQKTNYFSHNGTVILDIPYTDSFKFFLALNSIG